jgi:S-formylglutathione hydrolase
VPPQAERGKVPVLYWLSGLTCTCANFTEKAGVQRHAAAHGLIVVAPDTSPRVNLAGEDDAYDFGSGAGFYVDATAEPWARHYRMYTYVTKELPALVEANFPVDRGRQGIFGHSMGGHGALVCALKNPERYRSLSAFAPISAPMRSPWGEKAFSGYLGGNRDAWRAYDATQLAAHAEWQTEVLVDQGTADQFLDEQLKPQLLQEAFRSAGIPLTLRYQAGYDHSYYFMASFMADHVAHHARILDAKGI